MSLQARTVLNLIAGALAGALAWVVTDVTGWFSDVLNVNYQVRGFDLKYLLYGAVFGLLLGLLLGIVESLAMDSARQAGLTLGINAAIGFFGGGFGLLFGQFAWGTLGGTTDATALASPGKALIVLIARAVGWAVIGAIVGAAQGVGRRSPTIARQGAFGGFLGGALGGVLFQVIANLLQAVPNVAVLSRLTALVATGGLAGFFIGFVQNVFKQAWVRVIVGKNEGKEYLIAKSVTTIGRDELGDIGLFGDKNIAPTHAVIESLPAQKRHRLRHVAPGAGVGGPTYPPTRINGQPVTAEQWLADGDTIQIGKRSLLFHEKATAGGPRSLPPGVVPEPAKFAGKELETVPEAAFAPPSAVSVPPAAPVRASLTPSDDILAQMGTAPLPAAAPSVSTGGLGSRLACVAGPYSGQSFPLSYAPATLGRGSDRDIALPADTSISRAHARVSYQNGRHILADDGSSNGTNVNGARLSGPHVLSAGDVIQMGDTALKYE